MKIWHDNPPKNLRTFCFLIKAVSLFWRPSRPSRPISVFQPWTVLCSLGPKYNFAIQMACFLAFCRYLYFFCAIKIGFVAYKFMMLVLMENGIFSSKIQKSWKKIGQFFLTQKICKKTTKNILKKCWYQLSKALGVSSYQFWSRNFIGMGITAI